MSLQETLRTRGLTVFNNSFFYLCTLAFGVPIISHFGTYMNVHERT